MFEKQKGTRIQYFPKPQLSTGLLTHTHTHKDDLWGKREAHLPQNRKDKKQCCSHEDQYGFNDSWKFQYHTFDLNQSRLSHKIGFISHIYRSFAYQNLHHFAASTTVLFLGYRLRFDIAPPVDAKERNKAEQERAAVRGTHDHRT